MRPSYFAPLVVTLECHASFSAVLAGVFLWGKFFRASDRFTFQIESLCDCIKNRQAYCSEDENQDCAQPCRTPDIGNALPLINMFLEPFVHVSVTGNAM